MSDQITCPYCGSEWPGELEMRFCGHCGSKLGALSPEITDKERRTLTVVFADLSGFTSFSERQDPEAVEATVDTLLADLGGVVESYGGYVDKYMGDAVMAVFGAPEAHEDDPFRAVRSGLEMFDVLAEFNADRDLELSLSVGINTGEVLWSQVGGGDYTVTGDAVNVAQRLEAATDENAVLVSRSVERRTGDHVRYTRKDAIRVEGREEPVQPYVADGLRESTDRSEGSVHAPMFGRGAELARLLDRYEQKAPSFLAVTGPAGIGKSRLLSAFQDRLVEQSGIVGFGAGSCSEHAEIPLEPFGDVLLSKAGVGRGDPDAGRRVVGELLADFADSDFDRTRRENVAHLLAISAGLEVPDARVTELSAERRREETERAWLAWLRHRASERPVVLQFEDLHWADDATEDLLGTLQDRLVEEADSFAHSVTLLGTFRPEGTVPDAFEVVELTPLGAEDTRAVVEAVLGSPVGDQLVSFLQDQAAGNPYFLEELLRYLLENDVLARAGDEYRLPDRDARDVTVPETLNGLLVGRIDALRPGERETLKGASVVGQEFWAGLLADALDRAVEDAVAALAGREMVHPREESTLPDDREYAFEHALLREAAYELLPRSTREDLHATLSASLEAVARETAPPYRRALALAARHATGATDRERAGSLLTEAADLALQDTVYQEALTYAERALDTPSEVTARLQVARACKGLGRYDRSLDALESIGENADAAQQARALVLRAELLIRRERYEEAIELTDRVVDGDTDLGPRAGRMKGEALWRMGDHDEGEVVLQEALSALDERPETDGNVRLRAAVLRHIGNVDSRRGEYERAMESLSESLELVREIGDRMETARTLNTMGVFAAYLDEFEASREYQTESLEIRRELGDRWGQARSLGNLGIVARRQGDLDAAQEYQEESLQAFREVGAPKGETIALNELGNVARDRGDLETAREYQEQSLALAREAENPHRQAISLTVLADVAERRGDPGRADERFDEAVAVAPGDGTLLDMLRVLSVEEVLSACEQRGDPDRAIEWCDRIVDLAEQGGDDELVERVSERREEFVEQPQTEQSRSQ